MLNYAIRRLLYMIPIILGVALMVFMLFTNFGDDPVRVALGTHATPDSIANLRKLWGLDQPKYMQFLDFLRQIATFDYGVSFQSGRPLTDMFWAGALVSLSLTAPPFILGTLINLVLGLLLAYYRNSWFDRFARRTADEPDEQVSNG